jgi:photosystem II stability/assembly factor-like uncharacterized protein
MRTNNTKTALLAAVILVMTVIQPVLSQSWVLAGFVSNPGSRPCISVASPDLAWIADGNTTAPKVFRTTNSGQNWDVIPVGGIGNEIYCVWGFNATTAIVGEGIVSGGANMYKTTNSGLNWVSILQTPPNRGYFNGLAFTKANGGLFGLAIAERIYRSTNSGATWIEINAGVNGVSNAQNSLMIIDNQFYGFGMNNGAARIRLTTDNSTTWVTQTISVSGNYTSAIAFHTNKLLGVAATSTSPPIISRTTDGGLTWNNVNIGSGLSGECYFNWVPNTPVVYILGSNGGVKRSTDNGLTWILTPTAGVTNLTGFDFTHVNNVVYGYAVSSNGNVIKLSDTLQILTGNTNTNNETPNSFSLSQNYPNPFNPTSNINYSIPQNAYVKLTVFDALGREIAVLEDGLKQAGVYESVFNGSNFASGLYFYKLQAEYTSGGNTQSFTDTKKMLMVK